MQRSNTFQPGVPRVPLPPHLGWLDSSNNPGTQKQCSPHGGPSSLQMTTQSNQENDARTSLDYQRIQNELGEKSSQSVVNINVDGKIFSIKNQDRLTVDELSYKLVDQLYDDIRECDSDISKIAENLNYKAENVCRIKDHVFLDVHILDKYKDLGEEPEVKQFDPSLRQALAWKRLEAGVHTPDDVTWLKHEMVDSHHEKKLIQVIVKLMIVHKINSMGNYGVINLYYSLNN